MAFYTKKNPKAPGILSAGEQMLGKTADEGSPPPRDILPTASNKQFKLFRNQHF